MFPAKEDQEFEIQSKREIGLIYDNLKSRLNF
jgi:hypothetical protein